MAIQRQPYEIEFQKQSNRTFKQNIAKYTDNDINFLRGLNELYGNAMSARGLNLLDPMEAYFFHYNKRSVRSLADPPRVTRTYVFFTRPELNFSYENINAIPFFKWLYSKRIGKMIMATLTDPEYFINKPTALNNTSIDAESFNNILREYNSMIKEAEQTSANAAIETSYLKDLEKQSESGSMSDILTSMYDGYNPEAQNQTASTEDGQDDAQKVAELQIMNTSLKTSDSEEYVQNLEKSAGLVKSAYSKYLNEDEANNAALRKMLLGGSKYGYALEVRQAKNFFADIIPGFNYTTPFMPLLSTTCVSLDGAKDFDLDVFQSEEDHWGHFRKVATGMDSVWTPGSFSTSFEDVTYSPAALLFMLWVLYIHYVSRGYIMPTREHITERILDYTCSAYVFVIGENGRTIERMGRFAGCFPKNFPLSSQLLHNHTVDSEMLHKFSINWEYNYFEPMDPQSFMDFNFLSETEWLCKLKPHYWEQLYNRQGKSFQLSAYEGMRPGERRMLQAMQRDPNLWDIVRNPGMSGMAPRALITSSNSAEMSPFWKGYPVVKNGTELVWVTPEINTELRIRDVVENGRIGYEGWKSA